MKFANIEMLLLIWAVPLLFLVFFYGMKKRRKILSRFASSRSLKSIVLGASSDRRWLKAGLILCCLLFVSLALSGPQYGYKWQDIERRGIDIIIALDCSKSMLADDISPSRLDRAKREIYDLLTMLQGDRAGLAAFAGTAFLQCPLTLDYDAFNLFLKALSPDFLPVGGTDLGAAISTAMSGFDEKSNTEKAVILITDGENTGRGDPVKAAEKAKDADIKIFCIGVGSDQGVPIPSSQGGLKKDASGKIILTQLDEDTLKKIAVLTGGTYARSVAGDMDLDVIYTKEIRGKMESAAISSGRKQIWEDRYQWFLAIAMIVLMVELFLPSTKKSASMLIILFLLIIPVRSHAGPSGEGLEAYENGEYEKALKLFIDAQLESPDQPEILYNIGNAYYKLGEFDMAQKHYEQALKNEDKALKQKVIYNLGNACYRKGDFKTAIEKYEDTLKMTPNDVHAKQNLEFVKKVMAQKKEEKQNQQAQEGDDKKESGNKSQEQKSGFQEGDDKKESENKSQEQKSGSQEEKDDSQESKRPENQEQAQGENKDKEESSDEGQQQFGKEMDENQGPDMPKDSREEENTGYPQGDDPKDAEKEQAARILNRLNDKPGKVMIPAYQKRRVEKDW